MGGRWLAPGPAGGCWLVAQRGAAGRAGVRCLCGVKSGAPVTSGHVVVGGGWRPRNVRMVTAQQRPTHGGPDHRRAAAWCPWWDRGTSPCELAGPRHASSPPRLGRRRLLSLSCRSRSMAAACRAIAADGSTPGAKLLDAIAPAAKPSTSIILARRRQNQWSIKASCLWASSVGRVRRSLFGHGPPRGLGSITHPELGFERRERSCCRVL